MTQKNNKVEFEPITWLKCEAGLNPVEHYFAQEKPAPIAQKQGYCRLCWDEQLAINGYRKPLILRAQQYKTFKSPDSKPEKDSL